MNSMRICGADKAVKEFVELTRQHDTWEWKNIYNNQKARKLATLFDVIGCNGYIDIMTKKFLNQENHIFCFNSFEQTLIDNRLMQIKEKLKFYLTGMFTK